MPFRGEHSSLRASKRLRLSPKRLNGHSYQRIGDALTSGKQHIHLTRRRHRVHLRGKIKKLIGGVTHRRTYDNNIVPLLFSGNNPFSNSTYPLSALQRRSPIFLYDQCH